MAEAVFADVGRRYGAVTALEGFSLTVGDGELVAVLGPSGCGKSTLLRLVAGLESLSAGTIHLGGRRIDREPPQRRDVAMVFQSYALYPHMTVRENVEFPLRMRGLGREARRRRAAEVAESLELGALLERRPGALSGGQRQRVALARALVRQPRLFLLDEPLSNLDAQLRTSVRQYIRDVQRRFGVTTLYVTHDQTEAMTLGDRVVVLNDGRTEQVDTPLAVYERPASTFVAGFVGTPPMNLLAGRLAGGVLEVAGQRLALARPGLPAAGAVVVGVRPEAFGADAPPDALCAVPDPRTREVLGGETLVRATLGDGTARTEVVTVRLFGIVRELPSRVGAPPDTLQLFAAGDGRRLGV